MTQNNSNNFFNKYERNNKRFQTVKPVNINDIFLKKLTIIIIIRI